MSSAHHISFLEDFEITSANFREILFHETTGNPVPSDFNITNTTGVTAAQLVPSKALDLILAGTCVGCTLVVTLQMSPDGVNWCDCPLADGNPCTITCTELIGDCAVQIVDVPVLQYVRLKIGPAGSESTPQDQKICSVRLHFTLN